MILIVGVDDTTKTVIDLNVAHFIGGLEFHDGQDFYLDEWVGGRDSVYDAILIDTSIASSRAVRALRQSGSKVVVIGLCRDVDCNRSDVRADFLEQGGDDLLFAPLSVRELSASLIVAQRRADGRASPVISINVDGHVIKIHENAHIATIDNVPMDLTYTEYSILHVLMANSTKTMSKETIMSKAYRLDDNLPAIKIMDVFICKLRHKFFDAGVDGNKVITTVWGHGYTIGHRASSE